MKLDMKYWCSGLAVIGVIIALLGSTMVFADDINPGVFAIDSQPYGLTYGSGVRSGGSGRSRRRRLIIVPMNRVRYGSWLRRLTATASYLPIRRSCSRPST